MRFDPYLFFDGSCREAFTRYQEVFGGKLDIMTMGDAPSEEPVPPEQADVVIHASLDFGDGTFLMGSDDMTPEGTSGPVQGMMACWSSPDPDEARKVFAQLAEGGTVTQEPIQTFFSPVFAMCTDRFGTPWMVVADQPEA